jgi:hypothetical protein
VSKNSISTSASKTFIVTASRKLCQTIPYGEVPSEKEKLNAESVKQPKEIWDMAKCDEPEVFQYIESRNMHMFGISSRNTTKRVKNYQYLPVKRHLLEFPCPYVLKFIKCLNYILCGYYHITFQEKNFHGRSKIEAHRFVLLGHSRSLYKQKTET